MSDEKEKLIKLIISILDRTGEIPKVKLAKLILFAEIEHFKRTEKSITGLYFVRLKRGPVIAFFDDILEEGIGKYWDKNTKFIPIYEENRQKVQYSYVAKSKEIELSGEAKKTIDYIVDSYGNKTGTELSSLSHKLPAWEYSEPNEPIYIAELAIEDKNEYFSLIDLVEDIDEDEDNFLEEKISSALSRA